MRILVRHSNIRNETYRVKQKKWIKFKSVTAAEKGLSSYKDEPFIDIKLFDIDERNCKREI